MVLPRSNPTKSYWIEAAKSPLRNFQSASALPDKTDLVIVGSGYTGASAAYWIHKYTAEHGTTPQMVMLEAADVCGGATGRNGGQLRPHAYSRYPAWSKRFGPAGALELIQHEMAHLDAFRALLGAEGITDESCLKIGRTFDAAMTDEAWTRLKGAFDAFVADHGRDGPVIRDCYLIEDPKEAEAFTQMKGCIAAIVHPAGQVWPYRFVHALLRIVLATGHLQLHANTPVSAVSTQRDAEGYLTVTTASRGTIKAKSVLHATNRWASHLLPEFDNLVFPCRCTIAAIPAPPGFIRNTGAQHWDNTVNNYHNQLPPPYNAIIVGGAKAVCAHYPHAWLRSDAVDEQLPGVPYFYKTWPKSDIVGWPADTDATADKDDKESPLALPENEGGVWTGIETSSIDAFPFVGPVPGKPGQFVAAGFAGHGMPRILLSTAHLTPLILADLMQEKDGHGQTRWSTPSLAEAYPTLPPPFVLTAERMARLQKADAQVDYDADVAAHEASAKKPFCNEPRCLSWKTEKA